MSEPPGPQLDARIAEGFAKIARRSPLVPGYSRPRQLVQPAPRYSTDIAAAWQLVGWLQAMQFEVAVVTTPKERGHLGAWTCAVSNGAISVKSSGDTAALAMSRAMLAILTELERAL